MQHLVQADVVKPGEARMRPLPTRDGPLDVSAAIAEIDAQPELWNVFRLRQQAYVHGQVSDIWLRYNAWKNFNKKKPLDFIAKRHDSVWYPAYGKLPAVRQLIFDLMFGVRATALGGCLITRIPAGCNVGRHKDGGYNAEHYPRKFAIMLRSNIEQAFCFEGEKMLTVSGDVFEFDNAHEHWVTNESTEDRMTLILSIRTS